MKLLVSALAWTILCLTVQTNAALAQQPGRVYKIGWLWIGRPGVVPPPMEKWTEEGAAFRDSLRDAGYVIGKNFIVELRSANGDVAQLPAGAEALVASGVDVIVTNGTPPTVAAMQATKRIPIVFQGVGDPVEKGIVASLAKPGGNVTGMAVLIALAKQWELLREIAPSVRRAAWLTNAANRPAGAREADWYAVNRGLAAQVVKVLRGTSPGDIPVEQPTTYKLMINAKTAKALDLTVPPALLALADEVIE